MRRVGVAAIAAATALVPACGPPRVRTEAERTVTDHERGSRYVVPPSWMSFDGEIQSLSGSNFAIHVYELTGADPKFVKGLPTTLYPQLYGWAKHYFIVDGEPEKVWTTVGGLKSVEVTYPVRARKDSPPTKTTYWVVRRANRLHVLRVAYAPGSIEADERAVREMITHWEFIEPTPLRPAEPLP